VSDNRPDLSREVILVCDVVACLNASPHFSADPILHACVANLRARKDATSVITETLRAYAEERARLLAFVTRDAALHAAPSTAPVDAFATPAHNSGGRDPHPAGGDHDGRGSALRPGGPPAPQPRRAARRAAEGPMTPDALRRVIASARERPRMYGDDPGDLESYLHGLIAGAYGGDADASREAWASHRDRPLRPGVYPDATAGSVCDHALRVVDALWPQGDAARPDDALDFDEVMRLADEIGPEELDAEAERLRVEVAELVANAEGQRALVELLDRQAVDAASRYLADKAEAVERAVAPLREDARRWNARATELEEELERLRAVVAAVRREHDARAAWLASLPSGACSSPPPQALLDAEAATRAALRRGR
jgi:hypothetical protein